MHCLFQKHLNGSDEIKVNVQSINPHSNYIYFNLKSFPNEYEWLRRTIKSQLISSSSEYVVECHLQLYLLAMLPLPNTYKLLR